MFWVIILSFVWTMVVLCAFVSWFVTRPCSLCAASIWSGIWNDKISSLFLTLALIGPDPHMSCSSVIVRYWLQSTRAVAQRSDRTVARVSKWSSVCIKTSYLHRPCRWRKRNIFHSEKSFLKDKESCCSQHNNSEVWSGWNFLFELFFTPLLRRRENTDQ